MDDLYKLLQCSVCMDLLTDPRILPCHHSFCLGCISCLAGEDESSFNVITCPVCRRCVVLQPTAGGAMALEKDFRSEALLEVYCKLRVEESERKAAEKADVPHMMKMNDCKDFNDNRFIEGIDTPAYIPAQSDAVCDRDCARDRSSPYSCQPGLAEHPHSAQGHGDALARRGMTPDAHTFVPRQSHQTDVYREPRCDVTGRCGEGDCDRHPLSELQRLTLRLPDLVRMPAHYSPVMTSPHPGVDCYRAVSPPEPVFRLAEKVSTPEPAGVSYCAQCAPIGAFSVRAPVPPSLPLFAAPRPPLPYYPGYPAVHPMPCFPVSQPRYPADHPPQAYPMAPPDHPLPGYPGVPAGDPGVAPCGYPAGPAAPPAGYPGEQPPREAAEHQACELVSAESLDGSVQYSSDPSVSPHTEQLTSAFSSDESPESGGHTPAALTPAELTPAELTPAERTPAERTPAELTPAALTPAELTPAERTPAERTPAELPPAALTPAALSPAEPAEEEAPRPRGFAHNSELWQPPAKPSKPGYKLHENSATYYI